jgi:hypothetical protein
MLVQKFVVRVVLAGVLAVAVSACADISLPDLNTVFEDKPVSQKIKRDAYGNPILPKT